MYLIHSKYNNLLNVWISYEYIYIKTVLLNKITIPNKIFSYLFIYFKIYI